MPTINTQTSKTERFLNDVQRGLSQPQKTLPCKYFYDKRGSQLFDQICELDEYYVTRAEQAIMDVYAEEMAQQLGEGVKLLEFGSGSSTKTVALLEALLDPAAYVPIDISRKHLLETADRLRDQFPDLEILPVVADFTRPFEIPESSRPVTHNAVYFPGSTIGNFEPEAARQLLKQLARRLGQEGGLLIGADLQKDVAVLEAAYNDSEGVTAEFNLNLLRRANSELDANFDLSQFEHQAVYNASDGRIEMHLVSTEQQTVCVGEQEFEFSQGEWILTEHSHKYTVDGFEAMAAEAGFRLHQKWTDPQEYFCVFHFVLE